MYESGIKISNEEMERINIRLHRVHPKWNYTISPRNLSEK
ncbi:MAG TPA: hypothetical protein DCR39_10670 [Nitrospiraceae bacterium]|nr:hypothetical protein [Nitrospiraceae bacterium]